MTVAEVAAMLGTTPRDIRRRLRRAGIRPEGAGGYVLAQCDVDALTGSVAVDDPCRLPDRPGLPLSALGDPAMREAFTMLRFQREHRLMDLVSMSSCVTYAESSGTSYATNASLVTHSVSTWTP